MIPHERIRKWAYSFTKQREKDTQSDAVKIANIITGSLFAIIFLVVVVFFFLNLLNQTQTYEIDIELSGNISLPNYIHGFENITFDNVKIKGYAEMPVYYLRGLR